MSLEQAILEHASALRELAAALKAGFPSVASAPTIATVVSEQPKEEKKEERDPKSGPVFWKDSKTGHFGKVDTFADFKKLKRDIKTIVEIDEAEYAEHLVELREKNNVGKSEPADTHVAEKKASPAKSEPAPESRSDDEPPSQEDLIAVFTKYLPKDLDAEERKKRHAFVKPLLQRFGADKVSNLLPEHRALAIKLVEAKMAGKDVDPERANFADILDDDEGVI